MAVIFFYKAKPWRLEYIFCLSTVDFSEQRPLKIMITSLLLIGFFIQNLEFFPSFPHLPSHFLIQNLLKNLFYRTVLNVGIFSKKIQQANPNSQLIDLDINTRQVIAVLFLSGVPQSRRDNRTFPGWRVVRSPAGKGREWPWRKIPPMYGTGSKGRDGL